MGYSRSKVTLEKMLPTLQELNAGRPCAWMLDTPEQALKFAYQVREALFIAKLYSKEYPFLGQAAERFVIEVDGNKVAAVMSTNTTEAVILVDGERKPNNQGLAKAGPVLATSGPQSAFTIIDIWRRMQPSNDPINFPQAALDESNLLMLYNFCKNGTPPLMMMVSDDSVTIGLVDRAVVQYSWTPNKKPAGWQPLGFGATEDDEQPPEEVEVKDNDK